MMCPLLFIFVVPISSFVLFFIFRRNISVMMAENMTSTSQPGTSTMTAPDSVQMGPFGVTPAPSPSDDAPTTAAPSIAPEPEVRAPFSTASHSAGVRARRLNVVWPSAQPEQIGVALLCVVVPLWLLCLPLPRFQVSAPVATAGSAASSLVVTGAVVSTGTSLIGLGSTSGVSAFTTGGGMVSQLGRSHRRSSPGNDGPDRWVTSGGTLK